MTILPKKKQQSKDKAEADNTEKPHSPGGPAEARSSVVGPPRWSSPPPVDHELHPGPHDETVAGGHSGLSNNNKRRMRDRSPPHRNTRKQRHDGSAILRSGLHSAGASAAAGHGRLGAIRGQSSATTSAETSRTVTNQIGHIVGGGTTSKDSEEVNSGYNSEDECAPRDVNYDEQLERWFEAALKEKRGFIIKKMGEDGACLFRCVADQVFGDQEMHSIVRQNCVDYMAKNIDFFKQYVTEDFQLYLNRKRMDNCHGNHIEIQALSELYNRPIEVYQSGRSEHCLRPINTFHGSYKTDNDPIRVSYHKNVHYNSVIDPCKATIGVGLGLPGFQPGLADKNLLRDAVRTSEDYQLEQTMLEDKLRETDWEVTQETIEEQVARESYLQWLQDQEKYAKSARTSTRSACATCSTSTDTTSNWWDSSEPRSSRSPRSCNSASGGADNQGSPKPVLEPFSPATTSFDPKITEPSKSTSSPGAPGSPMCSAPSTSTSCDSTLGVGAVGGANASELGGGAVGGAVGGMGFQETSSLMNDLPPLLYGLSEYDDEDDVLARVIAQSQQEYFNSLMKSSNAATCNDSSIPRPSSDDVDCSSSKGKSRMPREPKH